MKDLISKILVPLFLITFSACGTESTGTSEDTTPSDGDTSTSDTADNTTSDNTGTGDGTSNSGDDTQSDDPTGDDNNDDPTGGDNTDDPTGGDDPRDTATFSRIVVDAEIEGPAFATLADMNADGRMDLVISSFGQVGFGIPNGAVTIYLQGETLEQWTKQSVVTPDDEIPFPNGATVADLDGDNDLDLIVGSGFLVCTVIPLGGPCGGISWFENLGDGSFERQIILDNTQDLFYHHAELVDFDNDGINDIVITGEAQGGFVGGTDRAEAQWFKGTGTGVLFETTPRAIGPGLGSFPRVRDIDGDGDLDVASAEYFHTAGDSFTWYERTAEPTAANPNGSFTRHVIDGDSGPSIMFTFVEDLFGDGELRALGANHTNTNASTPDPWESAVFLFEIPDNPTRPWTKTAISEGIESRPGSMFAPQAAPGIFGHGDMDDDGDIDVVVSGDGDPNIYWLEQVANQQFETHVLETDVGQAGAMKISDLDGDGKSDTLVSSYEQNALYIYQRSN